MSSSIVFGGSCFQKDILNLVYLCKHYRLDEVAEYWHQVVKINDYQKDRFAKTIIDHFGGDLIGIKIVILGWSFKANTNDSRESASISVTEKLYNAGANIEVFDPKVTSKTIEDDINFYWQSNFKQVSRKLIINTELKFDSNIDAYALLTEWNDFKNLDTSKTKVFDGRGILENSFFTIGKKPV